MRIHDGVRTCRSCDGDLVEVLDLGNQRLADFRDDNEVPPAFPLRLMFCPACGLAQLDTTVPRGLMYHERYGFKSGVNESIRADLKSVVASTLGRVSPRSWLDIASNDGTLLSIVPPAVYRAGIDPVAKYCREAEAHADHVTNGFFHPKFYDHQKFDVVSSVSMFYDIDDPNEFVQGVKQVIAPNGVWVIQQNYLGDTIRLNAVDNVCHEHITYWSLYSLQKLLHRHGLEVFDVEFSKVNGGCIRTFVARVGTREVDDRVAEHVAYELLNLGLASVNPFKAWSERVRSRLDALRAYVDGANDRGDCVAIYGASTRGGTVWQAAGFTDLDFAYAVDRNPEKVGKTMSTLGVPIVSEGVARDDHPEHMVVSIWFFRDEIVKREADYLAAGGKLVFAFPDFEVVG
jgi:NDP-4-keto-2,6-dideoxyhexose 3-C-methyltransferase